MVARRQLLFAGATSVLQRKRRQARNLPPVCQPSHVDSVASCQAVCRWYSTRDVAERTSGGRGAAETTLTDSPGVEREG